MQGEGAAWQIEQARNRDEVQQDAGVPEDKVRFQWQCAAQHTAEKRSRKCPGGPALTAETPASGMFQREWPR